MAMFTLEILCVGNELLSGIIINTNAHWISNKITESGGFVKRITVVGDAVNEIASAVKESIARDTELANLVRGSWSYIRR